MLNQDDRKKPGDRFLDSAVERVNGKALGDISLLSESDLRQLMVKLETVAQTEGYREEPKHQRIPSTIQAEIDAKLSEADFQILFDRLLLGYGFDVTEYGATGNGSTDDKTAISSAATAAAGRTLLFPAGTYRVASNISLDEDVVFCKGASLSIDSGITVTFTGTVTAGIYQIFGGDGDVSLAAGSCEYVLPQWWGAVGDDSTECHDAIEAAIAAAQNIGMVFIPSGIYRFANPIDNFTHRGIAAHTSHIVIQGAGMADTVLKYTGTSDYGIKLWNPAMDTDATSKVVNYVTIKDLLITCPNVTAGYGGVEFIGATKCALERVMFDDMGSGAGTAIQLRRKDYIYTEDSFTEDANLDFGTSGGGTNEAYAFAFDTVSSGGGQPRYVTIIMGKTGSPAGTITASFYTDSAGPDSLLGTASETITATDLSADAGGAAVTFSLPPDGDRDISASTKYWVVLETSGYTYSDGVTEIRLRVESGAGAADYFADYDAAWAVAGDHGVDSVITLRKEGAWFNKLRYVSNRSTNDPAIALSILDNSQVYMSHCAWEADTLVYTDGSAIISSISSVFDGTGDDKAINITGDDDSAGGIKTSWFGCYFEGSDAAQPMYFKSGFYHVFVGCDINGWMTWDPGTRMSFFDCKGPIFGTDDPAMPPDNRHRHRIYTPDTQIYSATATASDAASITGTAWFLDDSGDRVQLWLGPGVNRGFTYIPRGVYRVSVVARADSPNADDLKLAIWQDDTGGTQLDLQLHTTTTTYKTYEAYVVWRTANVVDRMLFRVESDNNASDIYVSHIIWEYMGPDTPTGYNLSAVNSTPTDIDGGRDSRIEFIGMQSGLELSVLAALSAWHEGSGDDQKGAWSLKANDGDDNFVPSKGISGDSAGDITIDGDLTIAGDDLKMATSTNAFILVADGTEFSPVPMSGDLSITNAGDTTVASMVACGFFTNNVAAAENSYAYVIGNVKGFTLPYAGSVVAISIWSNDARTAGELAATVHINGAGIGLVATLDAVNTIKDYTAQAAGIDTFSPGDVLKVHLDGDGSWAPTTADVSVLVFLKVSD